MIEPKTTGNQLHPLLIRRNSFPAQVLVQRRAFNPACFTDQRNSRLFLLQVISPSASRCIPDLQPHHTTDAFSCAVSLHYSLSDIYLPKSEKSYISYRAGYNKGVSMTGLPISHRYPLVVILYGNVCLLNGNLDLRLLSPALYRNC